MMTRGLFATRRPLVDGSPVALFSAVGRFWLGVAVLLGSLACAAVWWACGSNPTRPSPTCEFLPDTLDFPVIAAGDTAVLTTHLVSLAEKDQAVRLLVGSSDFTVLGPDTGATFALAAQGTAQVTVRFHPTSAGPKTAQVQVEGARCDPLVCSAAAEWDACVVEPLRLVFGRVEVGEAKTLPFTIHCTGPDSTSGRVEASCAEYAITSGSGPFSLAPGESLRVEVSYRAQTRGEARCTITLGEGWCEPVECVGTSLKTWRVRVDGTGDAPTVQAAIGVAASADTVLVYPGRYYENLDYLGKDLVVKSAEGPETTILDGSLRDSSVVVIRRGETRAAVLEGFTITGGRGSTIWGKAQDGGGICCEESSPTIRGNKIVGNSCGSRGDGGGICAGARYVDPPSGALIEGNIIENNESGHNGGGLACFNGNYEIRGNVFRGNLCWADGGGAWVWMVQGQAALEGNEFWDNVAGDHGGGIYSAGGSGAGQYSIEGNLFVRNRTVGTGFFGDTGSGGAIAALMMRGVIRYNTLVWNDGHHLTHDGGGGLLLYLTGVDLAVYGNLVAYNEECGISCWWEGTTAAMGANLVWGNGGGDLGTGSGECPGSWADVLFFADPLFCDPDNDDYRVASNSPALTGEEVMGAYSEPGCGPRQSVSASAWNRLRALYPN